MATAEYGRYHYTGTATVASTRGQPHLRRGLPGLHGHAQGVQFQPKESMLVNWSFQMGKTRTEPSAQENVFLISSMVAGSMVCSLRICSVASGLVVEFSRWLKDDRINKQRTS